MLKKMRIVQMTIKNNFKILNSIIATGCLANKLNNPKYLDKGSKVNHRTTPKRGTPLCKVIRAHSSPCKAFSSHKVDLITTLLCKIPKIKLVP